MKNSSTYRQKAKDSFKTKLNLFLFARIINNSGHVFSDDEFHDYKISKAIVDKYTAEYWQQTEVDGLSCEKDIHYPIVIWKEKNQVWIQSLEKEYISLFPKVFPPDDFNELISVEQCAYCNTSIKQIEILVEKKQVFKKSLRGWSLEIDRKNSNLEYSKDNCVMACYWCNNAKTDEFSYDEFIEIGKSIEAIWKLRLNKI